MESIETLRKTARAAQERIGEIEAEARRKANGKKVGKTFKTSNSYSCPEGPKDRWFLYSKVTRMDEDGFLYTFDFQTDKYGNVNIRFDNYAYHMQGHTPIPAGEFNAAWKRLRAKIDAA